MSSVLLLLPDFALILLGFGLRRQMHLGDHFWSGLEKLIYFVLFPAPALQCHCPHPHRLWRSRTVHRQRYGCDAGRHPPRDAGAAHVRSAPAGEGKSRGMIFASRFQCAFRFNSYIGLAVAGNLHGEAGIAAMGILIGAMVPMANLASVWMLARHGQLGVCANSHAIR
ncbi:MAG: hypothetical protein M5R42_00475 [Rhodocyclaceae bacterium]|nr:hypothetical protein [Rhodocyclaceae bacterium]